MVRDFLTFLKSGQGPVEFGEKIHFDHQNWGNLMQSAILNRLKTIRN